MQPENIYVRPVRHSGPISRILSPRPKPKVPSFIWAGPHGPALSAYPPRASCECWAGNPLRRYAPRFTWHFNTQGLSSPHVAVPGRALLPHVFTLTARDGREAVIFCDTALYPRDRVPPVRRCVALRCPDFPPHSAVKRSGATGWPAVAHVGLCNDRLSMCTAFAARCKYRIILNGVAFWTLVPTFFVFLHFLNRFAQNIVPRNRE